MGIIDAIYRGSLWAVGFFATSANLQIEIRDSRSRPMLLFETGTLSGAITIKFACDGAGEVWPSGASYAIVKVKSGSTTVNYGASADNPLVFETSPVDMTPTADSPDAYAVGDVFYIGEYPVQ